MAKKKKVKVEQSFVLIKNLTRGPSGFSDHRNSPIILSPVGTADDSIKILMKPEEIRRGAQHYLTYKKTGQFFVAFSADIDADGIPQSESKMTVTSNADVNAAMAKRINELRKDRDAKILGKKSVGMRLARARAMSAILQPGGEKKVVLTNKGPADVAQQNAIAEAKEKVKADKAAGKEETPKAKKTSKVKETPKVKKEETPKAPEPKREPLIDTSQDKGEEMSLESLSKKGRPDLIEIATKLEIPLRRGISARGIVNAILLKINKG